MGNTTSLGQAGRAAKCFRRKRMVSSQTPEKVVYSQASNWMVHTAVNSEIRAGVVEDVEACQFRLAVAAIIPKWGHASVSKSLCR